MQLFDLLGQRCLLLLECLNLVAQLPASFAADDNDGLAAGNLVTPRGHDGVWREPPRLAGEFEKGGLGNFLGELRGADLVERGGMDEIKMTPDDFGEGVLIVLPGVPREQFQVGIAHVQKDNVAGARNPTEIPAASYFGGGGAATHLKSRDRRVSSRLYFRGVVAQFWSRRAVSSRYCGQGVSGNTKA